MYFIASKIKISERFRILYGFNNVFKFCTFYGYFYAFYVIVRHKSKCLSYKNWKTELGIGQYMMRS